MSEIADFLRARYKQEAHVARLVADSTGSELWKADWRQLSHNHIDARVIAGPDNPVFDGYGSVATAEFVSGYSPARVIADLDAKLALIDLHVSVELAGLGELMDACAVCEVTGKYPEYPCTTLRLLAQPFAGHPDHKGGEWAP